MSLKQQSTYKQEGATFAPLVEAFEQDMVIPDSQSMQDGAMFSPVHGENVEPIAMTEEANSAGAGFNELPLGD